MFGMFKDCAERVALVSPPTIYLSQNHELCYLTSNRWRPGLSTLFRNTFCSPAVSVVSRSVLRARVLTPPSNLPAINVHDSMARRSPTTPSFRVRSAKQKLPGVPQRRFCTNAWGPYGSRSSQRDRYRLKNVFICAWPARTRSDNPPTSSTSLTT